MGQQKQYEKKQGRRHVEKQQFRCFEQISHRTPSSLSAAMTVILHQRLSIGDV
jgi:hypothetical protein